MQTKKEEVNGGGRGVFRAGEVVRAMSRAGAARLGAWAIDKIVDVKGRAVEELMGKRGAIPCGWDEVCLMHPLALHVPLGDLQSLIKCMTMPLWLTCYIKFIEHESFISINIYYYE